MKKRSIQLQIPGVNICPKNLKLSTLKSGYFETVCPDQPKNLQNWLSLGEQSFKDADVLSEKNNFSAPGGPESAPFDTDDDDILYFEVSIVYSECQMDHN